MPTEGEGVSRCVGWWPPLLVSLSLFLGGPGVGAQHSEVGIADVHLPLGTECAEQRPPRVPREPVLGSARTLWGSELAPASALGTEAPGCVLGG